jgi:hypothetical protein
VESREDHQGNIYVDQKGDVLRMDKADMYKGWFGLILLMVMIVVFLPTGIASMCCLFVIMVIFFVTILISFGVA